MSQVYADAADALARVFSGRESLKKAILSRVKESQVGKVMLLAAEALRWHSVVDKLITRVPALARDPICTGRRELVLVMLYDLLLSPRKSLEGGGLVKRKLLAHHNALRTALARLKIDARVRADEELLPAHAQSQIELPRYVRVNTLVVSVDEALAYFTTPLPAGETPARGSLRGRFHLVAKAPSLARLAAAPVSAAAKLHGAGSTGVVAAASDPAAATAAAAAAAPAAATAAAAAAAPAAATATAAAAPATATATATASRALASASSDWVARDEHLAELLVFAPRVDFHADPLFLRGGLVLQDKASCMPAVVLAPPPGAAVIDGCAAPGNKTSHLAALMRNEGSVLACDKSLARLGTLRMLTRRAGATCVVPAHQDFLAIEPSGPLAASVTHVLLDPSCSGSGIVARRDLLVAAAQQSARAKASAADGGGDDGGDEEVDELTQSLEATPERLAALATFQRDAVLHAMRFPRVRAISYSTCSVHVAENEAVVGAVLAAAPPGWALARALPQWPRRGLVGQGGLSPAQASALVRTDPSADATIGFFVALFVRDPSSSVGASASTSASMPTPVAVGAMPWLAASSASAAPAPAPAPSPAPAPAPAGLSASQKKRLKRKKSRTNPAVAADVMDAVSGAPAGATCSTQGIAPDELSSIVHQPERKRKRVHSGSSSSSAPGDHKRAREAH